MLDRTLGSTTAFGYHETADRRVLRILDADQPPVDARQDPGFDQPYHH
jgi:hypothetical protein